MELDRWFNLKIHEQIIADGLFQQNWYIVLGEPHIPQKTCSKLLRKFFVILFKNLIVFTDRFRKIHI